MSEKTLSSLLSTHAEERGAKTVYTFLNDGQTESGRLTFASLDRSARAVAARLHTLVKPGSRALLLAADNMQFIRGFLACQHAGVIAVPVAPPVPLGSERRVATLRAIARDCDAGVVLSESAAGLHEPVSSVAPEIGALPWLATDTVGDDEADAYQAPRIGADDLSFLQYTSGSTSTPKGVMVTHRALLANEEMFSVCMGLTEDDVLVSWLPLFHDMGLIGKMLQTLYLGASAVMMPPVAFVQRPARWLRALTRYRGTATGAPNFAYDLCVRRIPVEERAEFDLSHWKLAFSGAEPIRPATLHAFAEAYAPYGFKSTALYPAYGLAESTLITTGGTPGGGAKVLSVDRAALHQGRVEPGTDHELVSVGGPRLSRRIQIADPDTHASLPDGSVGEVWIAGDDIAVGYWGRREATLETFAARTSDTGAGPFLRTGDLGAMYDGELYITGRLKDLLIVGGKNHYPQDIELSAESAHAWVRPSFCAAFSVERDGHERVVLVAEVLRPAEQRRSGFSGPAPALAEIAMRVRAAVSADHGIVVDDLVLAAPGTVPKTSSGKVQRRAAKALYEDGRVKPAADPARAKVKEVG
ncbi:fatty acyl-AMP ligase [Yinghuangia seranimata]|uniref:fatty acyl-AMP ligase n=1 Tax=Yinghuangia seranimata TaxID=408067 RepID=UPI00248CF2D1|nr:fatty acyl-AMP ligase [Yinghuangia seranimata]MDI2127660.1 fatty acyl-AMP ligase [Yinghuangia seranimata]